MFARATHCYAAPCSQFSFPSIFRQTPTLSNVKHWDWSMTSRHRFQRGVATPYFLRTSLFSSRSTTGRNSRRRRTGINRGTSSLTTVHSTIPLTPPMPIGISTTPITRASPPTPRACAFFPVQQARSPCCASSVCRRFKEASPTSPDWAAVSTTACCGSVTMACTFQEWFFRKVAQKQWTAWGFLLPKELSQNRSQKLPLPAHWKNPSWPAELLLPALLVFSELLTVLPLE